MSAVLLRGLVDSAQVAAWRERIDALPGGSVPLLGVLDLPALCQWLPIPAPAWLVASQCWARRALPPHHWHQDGALHHDFTTPAVPLPMGTLWIALTPCGDDAPGLEWAEPSPDELLPPAALTDAAVRTRFSHFVRPVFAPGDAVRFDGRLLHRTHVPPQASQPRTSIELRWLQDEGPVPARLAGEMLIAIR